MIGPGQDWRRQTFGRNWVDPVAATISRNFNGKIVWNTGHVVSVIQCVYHNLLLFSTGKCFNDWNHRLVRFFTVNQFMNRLVLIICRTLNFCYA